MTKSCKKLITEIRNAQTEILRRAPYRDASLVPNPGASPGAIIAAERRVGRALPPSYRSFLAQHDGWARFFEGASLLGTRALGQPRYAELLASMFGNNPVSPAARGAARWRSLIPFGMDTQVTTVFAFNPLVQRPDGELEVVAWVNEIGLRSPSFPDFLETVLELCHSELGQWSGVQKSA